MKNEGNPSDQIVQRTDVAGPSPPYVVNLTCHSQDAIAIRWRRPHEFYNTIDFYIIKTRVVGQDNHRDIRINASAKELETAVSQCCSVKCGKWEMSWCWKNVAAAFACMRLCLKQCGEKLQSSELIERNLENIANVRCLCGW